MRAPIKFKLGKKAARRDDRTLKISRYLAAPPPLPAAIDWGGNVGVWGELGNDAVGDCTFAGPGHLEMLWTADSGTEFNPTTEQVLADYSAVTGYNPADPSTDQGADMLTVMNYWRQTGIAGHKIYSFMTIGSSAMAEVKSAIAFFGGANIGVQLPQSAMDATNAGEPWSVTDDDNILGGHCVILSAYDADGLTCVTWGQEQKLTWGWLQKYCDEAYCALSPDWIGANGLAPSGFNLTQLQSDLASITSSAGGTASAPI
jgi:hypothetical protein